MVIENQADAPERVSRKVRHAMVQWQEGGINLNAFRGQIVDMPAEDAARLERAGALIPVDIDLDRPGRLMELGEEASDEELINWMISASPAEIAALIRQRPEMEPRVNGAYRRIVSERERQDEHLRQVQAALRGEVVSPPADVRTDGVRAVDDDILVGDINGLDLPSGRDDTAVVMPPEQETSQLRSDGYIEQPASGTDPDDDLDDYDDGTVIAGAGDATDPTDTADGGGDDDIIVTLSVSDAAAIVGGTVDTVVDYLADNPEHAAVIMAAERNRADANNKQPRNGVVRAVEAAIAHTE